MQLGLGLALPPFSLRGGLDQFVRSMFAGGEAGAWYDPSDLSTMFQTAGGPAVSATGQSCGLILDKRLGLALSDELVANPSFDSATGWSLTAGWAITGGNLVMADSVTDSGQGAYHALSISTGDWVKVEIEVTAMSTSAFSTELCTDSGGANTSGTINLTPTGAGTRVAYLRCTASQTGFRLRTQSGTGRSATIASVSVKKIAGNHAYQAASASRPIFRDVGGYRYLEYDGVDDHMIVELATTIVGPELYGAGGVLQDSAGTAFMRHFGCGVTGDSDAGNNAYCDLLSAGSPAQIYSYRASASRGFSGAVADVPMVAESIFDGVNAFTAFNAVDGTPAASTGAFSIQQVYIGASPNLAATDFLIGNHYALIFREGPITPAQRVVVRQLLAVKCGVTI